MPIWLPSSPMRRTWGTRIRSLTRVSSRSGGRRSNLRGIGTTCSWGGLSKRADVEARHSYVSSLAFICDLVTRPLGELAGGHRADVALAVAPDGHLARGLFLVSHHEHVEDLGQLCLADLLADRLR